MMPDTNWESKNTSLICHVGLETKAMYSMGNDLISFMLFVYIVCSMFCVNVANYMSVDIITCKTELCEFWIVL